MHGLQPQRPCQYVPFASALRPRIAWPTARCKQRFGSASAAASSAADAGLAAEQNLLDNLFQDLCKHHGITSSVQLKHSDGGVGLFAAEPIAKGHTILRVPRSMCILIDNEAGSMTIPPGTCASIKMEKVCMWPNDYQRQMLPCRLHELCRHHSHITDRKASNTCALEPLKYMLYFGNKMLAAALTTACYPALARPDNLFLASAAGPWPRLSGGLMQQEPLTCMW